MMKYFVLCISILMLLAACSETSTGSADKFPKNLSSQDQNKFVLIVDRISEGPNVQFPNSDLKESDYSVTNTGTQYEIVFTEKGRIVAIETGAIQGRKINDSNESIEYELEQGTTAGGRFVVWNNDDKLEAELTIYGSGVPIIKSEGGRLQPK